MIRQKYDRCDCEGLLLYGPADNDEKVTSSKIYISIIHAVFQTKVAETSYPLVPHMPI